MEPTLKHITSLGYDRITGIHGKYEQRRMGLPKGWISSLLSGLHLSVFAATSLSFAIGLRRKLVRRKGEKTVCSAVKILVANIYPSHGQRLVCHLRPAVDECLGLFHLHTFATRSILRKSKDPCLNHIFAALDLFFSAFQRPKSHFLVGEAPDSHDWQ